MITKINLNTKHMKNVLIGKYLLGDNQPSFIIAEIGINHNGDLELAKKLIDAAVDAGCQAVKFQKRTVDVVYTAEELAKSRPNPFGETNGDLKRGLEFGKDQYDAIADYCKKKDVLWTASCWDEESVDFIANYQPAFFKIASASLTDDELLKRHRRHNMPIILSTGMSTLAQIDHAVEILGKENLIILHCTSTYPSKPEELNLRAISALKSRYGIPVGYSGHEVGLATSVASVALGACVVERHITLDRSMWGSDQAASVEPGGFERMVKDIRAIEKAMGDGNKVVYETELPIIDKLRRVGK